jgi:FAD/FMN-containing dehydrogenase
MSFRRVAIAQLAATFPEYEVCDFGHVADGGVHFNLVQRTSTTPEAARTEELRDHVLDLAVRDFGASFSGEHGIGRANQGAYDHYTPAAIATYSAAIAGIFARLPAAAVRFGPPPSAGERG